MNQIGFAKCHSLCKNQFLVVDVKNNDVSMIDVNTDDIHKFKNFSPLKEAHIEMIQNQEFNDWPENPKIHEQSFDIISEVKINVCK